MSKHDNLIITKLSKTNPHAEGTVRHARWAAIKSGMTVKQYAEKDGVRLYLYRMEAAKHLKLEAPKAKASKKSAPKAEAATA